MVRRLGWPYLVGVAHWASGGAMHQFGAHGSNNGSDSTNLVHWKSRKAPPTLWAEPRYKERMVFARGRESTRNLPMPIVRREAPCPGRPVGPRQPRSRAAALGLKHRVTLGSTAAFPPAPCGGILDTAHWACEAHRPSPFPPTIATNSSSPSMVAQRLPSETPSRASNDLADAKAEISSQAIQEAIKTASWARST